MYVLYHTCMVNHIELVLFNPLLFVNDENVMCLTDIVYKHVMYPTLHISHIIQCQIRCNFVIKIKDLLQKTSGLIESKLYQSDRQLNLKLK